MTALLSDLGCVPLTVDLDRRDTGLSTASRARSLLSTVELYRRDLTIYLGADSGCLEGWKLCWKALRNGNVWSVPGAPR